MLRPDGTPIPKKRKLSFEEQETEDIPTHSDLLEIIQVTSETEHKDTFTVFLAKVANFRTIELPRAMTYQSALDLLRI